MLVCLFASFAGACQWNPCEPCLGFPNPSWTARLAPFPKNLGEEVEPARGAQLLPVRSEQLLFDLLGLSAVEIPNRGHEVDVEVTGFESSSALKL